MIVDCFRFRTVFFFVRTSHKPVTMFHQLRSVIFELCTKLIDGLYKQWQLAFELSCTDVAVVEVWALCVAAMFTHNCAVVPSMEVRRGANEGEREVGCRAGAGHAVTASHSV